MDATRSALKLTHAAALAVVNAAATHAAAMGVPQCITVVDEGTNLLAFLRMDGARVLSIASSRKKAMTASVTGLPTGNFAAEVGTGLAIATGGDLINLKGGLPIIIAGHLVGGIGVGSGTGEQDLEVARAGLAALAEATQFPA